MKTKRAVIDGMSRREIEEMEQIEKGLEAFLQQEIQGMDNSAAEKGEPRFFDMREPYEEEENPPEESSENTDGDWEKEIDVISTSKRNRSKGNRSRSTRRNAPEEDYIEDWDNPGPRKSGGRKSTSTGRSAGSRSAGSRSAGSKSTGSRSAGGKSTDSRSVGSRGTGSRSAGSRGTGSRSAGSKSTEDRSSGSSSHSGNSKSRGKEQPKKKRFSRLKRFLVVVLVLLLLGAIGLYQLVGSVYGKLNYREITSVVDAPYREDGVINILLIGNDSRENGEDGRSDAMILLSISSKTKQIYMTSLLRDMYVDIPGHDGNRLNAAYSYGGAELLMETIEKNLDISVNRYVQVNFEAFANLVDAVGGVDLELTTAEIELVNGYLVEYNMLTNRPQGTDNMDTSVSGMVHLNGPQALAYTRNRYIGTDFGRTERQRKVLSAVIKKLPLAMVTNPGELTDGLMPNLTTNLTQWECYLLSFQAGKLLTYDIVQGSIPIEGSYRDATIRGMAVLEVDFDVNRQYLRENVYGQTH